jgi:hypothetical protein
MECCNPLRHFITPNSPGGSDLRERAATLRKLAILADSDGKLRACRFPERQPGRLSAESGWKPDFRSRRARFLAQIHYE